MNKTILLVSEQEKVLSALSHVLGDVKYTFLKASNDKEAFKMLENDSQQIQLVIVTNKELVETIREKYANIMAISLDKSVYLQSWDDEFLLQRIEEAVIEYKIQEVIRVEKEKMASYDILTGLFNREGFMKAVQEFVAFSRDARKHFVLVLIDIDRFGGINNQFGQHIGNQVLQAVAKRLSEWTKNEVPLGRIGNDEFALLLKDFPDIHQIRVLVNGIEEVLKKSFAILDREIYITFGMGVTVYPQDSDRSDLLLEKAYVALNASKKLGGGIAQFYEPTMEEEARSNLLLEVDIHKALEAEQFVNFYQPIVSLETGRVIGSEALIRWQHPQRGLMTPLQFLPVCELSNLIIPIDIAVLHQAIADTRLFDTMGVGELFISSNFSPRHFMRLGLAEVIQEMIEKMKITPENVTIEVTERVLLQSTSVVQEVLQSLHTLGVRLAIDDFGTGYASLSYLKNYPFDYIKIDRNYVQGIGRVKNDEVLLTAMVNMAKGLGLKVIAEGLDAQNQIDFLKDKGCDAAQGFIFSHPMTRYDFTKKLTSEEFKKSIQYMVL